MSTDGIDLSVLNVNAKIVDTKLFKKAVAHVFKSIDTDDSGSIDKDELVRQSPYFIPTPDRHARCVGRPSAHD